MLREAERMPRLMIALFIAILLSGCAMKTTYTVRIGIEDDTYQEKRNVDPTLAEDGREWHDNKPPLAVGSCEFYRRKGVFLGDPPADARQGRPKQREGDLAR